MVVSWTALKSIQASRNAPLAPAEEARDRSRGVDAGAPGSTGRTAGATHTSSVLVSADLRCGRVNSAGERAVGGTVKWGEEFIPYGVQGRPSVRGQGH